MFKFLAKKFIGSELEHDFRGLKSLAPPLRLNTAVQTVQCIEYGFSLIDAGESIQQVCQLCRNFRVTADSVSRDYDDPTHLTASLPCHFFHGLSDKYSQKESVEVCASILQNLYNILAQDAMHALGSEKDAKQLDEAVRILNRRLGIKQSYQEFPKRAENVAISKAASISMEDAYGSLPVQPRATGSIGKPPVDLPLHMQSEKSTLLSQSVDASFSYANNTIPGATSNDINRSRESKGRLIKGIDYSIESDDEYVHIAAMELASSDRKSDIFWNLISELGDAEKAQKKYIAIRSKELEAADRVRSIIDGGVRVDKQCLLRSDVKKFSADWFNCFALANGHCAVLFDTTYLIYETLGYAKAATASYSHVQSMSTEGLLRIFPKSDIRVH